MIHHCTTKYLSQKGMAPKRQHLTVIWQPLKYVLTKKHVFLKKNFGHNWFQQLSLLKTFQSETLWDCPWMALFVAEFPWGKHVCGTDFNILLEDEGTEKHAHFLGFLLVWWQSGSYYALNPVIQDEGFLLLLLFFSPWRRHDWGFVIWQQKKTAGD